MVEREYAASDDGVDVGGNDSEPIGTLGSGLVAFSRGRWLPAALGSILVLYLVVPFAVFLARASPDGVLEGLTDPATLAAIRISLLTAPISTGIATLFGVPLAYVLSRSSFRGKRLVEVVVLLPLVLPPVVGGAVLLAFVGRHTPVGATAAALGVPLTDSLVGVILAQTFVAAPFLVVTARAGFDAVDPRLEEAARTMGYGPLGTFRRVSLPLARTAIVAGIVLTFVRAVGEFGATMMVAYSPRTMPTQLWVTFVSQGLDAVVPLVIVLLAITLSVVVCIHLVVGSRW